MPAAISRACRKLGCSRTTIDRPGYLQAPVAAQRHLRKAIRLQLNDATSTELTDSVERNYFTLRSRIEFAGKKIAGLQQYIREQCLN